MKDPNKNENSRMRIKGRQRATQRFKIRLVIAAASAMFFVVGACVVYFNLGVSNESRAAAAGDYRSLISGNWNALGTWEKYDGSTWLPALTTPRSTDGIISVQNGHTVTINANVTVDQVSVESGGILTVSAGTLTIANGTGSDLNVAGTTNLVTGGTIAIAASALVTVLNGGTFNHNGGARTLTGWAINNGGVYVHNVNNITIPTASWGALSTLKVTGVTTANLRGTNQTFGNLIYDCTLQTGIVEFWDNLLAIQGDLTVLSTGSSSIFLQKASSGVPIVVSGNYMQSGGIVYGTKGAAFTLSINGTFTMNGGTFIEVERYGMPVMNIYGVFTINAGTFNHSTYNSNLANEGIGTVNLFNNYVRTGGLHTETATLTGRGEFNFAKTGTQTFTYSGGSITNTVNFTVNDGAILDLATYAITGGGSFTLASGGGLILASANGITSSGASGNVQVTGTRNFGTNGDFTYNGATAQVTGNGLPATVRNLTINNANDVTLTTSSSATALITLTAGRVITGSNILGTTNDATSSIVNYSATNYVVGNLQRSVAATGAYDFPVGNLDYYELANVTFTGMTGTSSLLTSFIKGDPIDPSYPLAGLAINSTPVNDILNYGYWAITPDNAMSGGTYSITLNEKGHTNSAENPNEYGVIKRNNSSSYWESHGTHSNGTQSESNGVATASRSGLSAFSHFAIGKGTGPLPVNLINFEAKVKGINVVCNWLTFAEVNNDYFTLERSADGIRFTQIARVTGSGTTSNPHNYSYIDTEPLEGTSYYRLKQTDYDGESEMFQTISVKRNATKGTGNIVKVYPNPVIDNFSVQFEAEEDGDGEIIISTMNGTIVLAEKVNFNNGRNNIDLTMPLSAKSGTYIMRVVNENQEFPVVKFMKK